MNLKVVDQDDVINDIRRDFQQRPFQGAGGIVGGQHNTHIFLVDHAHTVPSDFAEEHQ
jgi:hypothetical protein